MRDLTARQKAALRTTGNTVATLVAMDLPDGTLYAWSGTGILDHGGHEWLGAGLVAGVTGVQSSTEPSVSNIGFVLTGVPSDALQVATEDLKGYTATCYHAIMTPDRRVIDDALVGDIADLNYQESQGTDDGTFTTVVMGQSGFWQLENASNRLWTPEQARADYPDGSDTGFDLLAELEDYEVTWTRT